MSALDAPTLNPTARPPRAPPLPSMPSTPGPQVPGGYPRNSVVFSTNKWEQNTAPGLLAAAKTYIPAPIAKAKAYFPADVASYLPADASPSPVELPINVGSYFPPVPHSSDASSNSATPSSNTTLDVHTPYLREPLRTDGTAASDFSTRAYAGSGSSRYTPTPLPSDYVPYTPPAAPSTPGASDTASEPLYQRPMSDASTAATSTGPGTPPAERRRTQLIDPGVVPLASSSSSPQVAAPASASSGSRSGSASDASTPPSSFASSPASTSSPKSGGAKGFVRWASRSMRGRGRASLDGAPPPSAFGRGAPPSAFAARGSLDSNSNTFASSNAAGKPLPAPAAAPARTPSRRASLLRTLRGEATVLAGKVRRDPARVEAGRRMMGGA
ncbi:hypothetical protein C8R44DRAFT_751310 [Mycena epipterygia]|nr:hypothetical protein C8R44DRAFT_751310 [Mycena epipterygia]